MPFGFCTVIVGDMPLYDIGDILNAVEALDGPKVRQTPIVRAQLVAWLGEWPIDELTAIVEEAGSDDQAYYELTSRYPTRPKCSGDDPAGPDRLPIIAGADHPLGFYLDIGLVREMRHPASPDDCLWMAAHSLVHDDPQQPRFVYSIIMDAATYAIPQARVMGKHVRNRQVDTLRFDTRLLIINIDGPMEMRQA